MHPEQDKIIQGLIGVVSKLIFVIVVLLAGIIAMPFVLNYYEDAKKVNPETTKIVLVDTVSYWMAPNTDTISNTKQQEQVTYGKDLIAHTSKYFGPNGSVLKISNGMNCQNCHLQAGTVTWGNNYGSVASLYPKFRARSGTLENVYKRVNDCIERSLNGQAIDTAGKEMQAIVAYINFIGSNVEKGKKAAGSGFKELPYLDRAANPEIGQTLYAAKCQSCHQANGEGLLNADKTEFTYPALWGNQSYNDGAGLFRLSNFAKYIKDNMPQGSTYKNPQLSDEEAWDIAAFVNSQKRPHINTPKDWPDINKKPIDHPFGPYMDPYTEQQHKYGPFKPMLEKGKK